MHEVKAVRCLFVQGLRLVTTVLIAITFTMVNIKFMSQRCFYMLHTYYSVELTTSYSVESKAVK